MTNNPDWRPLTPEERKRLDSWPWALLAIAGPLLAVFILAIVAIAHAWA